MRIATVFKFFVLVVMLVAVGFFSYKTGVLVGEENILKTPPAYVELGEEAENVDLSVFWEVWRQIEIKFLEKDKIDYKEMIYGAISGMVDSFGDPYTTFFDPNQTESFEEELRGKYEGVGMYVGIKDNQLTVISPLKDSPAEKAGLKPEDKIVQIEETYTLDLSIEEAVSLIKGPKGSEVKLLIQRKGWKEPKEFIMTRQVIKIPTLDYEALDNNIALIKIYQFNQILTSEFNRVALEILDSETDKFIIDLRNNPGGYLEVAQNIAGWFITKGEVVVWQDEGDEDNRKRYDSNGPALFLDYPVVVLINGGSASGAEILAGALRDQNGSKLVGTKSFGKGSVQEQVQLSDSSSLKVTIAKWLTPNGDLIHELGLEPDIEVEMPETEDDEEPQDTQLEKAVEILNNLE